MMDRNDNEDLSQPQPKAECLALCSVNEWVLLLMAHYVLTVSFNPHIKTELTLAFLC